MRSAGAISRIAAGLRPGANGGGVCARPRASSPTAADGPTQPGLRRGPAHSSDVGAPSLARLELQIALPIPVFDTHYRRLPAWPQPLRYAKYLPFPPWPWARSMGRPLDAGILVSPDSGVLAVCFHRDWLGQRKDRAIASLTFLPSSAGAGPGPGFAVGAGRSYYVPMAVRHPHDVGRPMSPVFVPATGMALPGSFPSARRAGLFSPPVVYVPGVPLINISKGFGSAIAEEWE